MSINNGVGTVTGTSVTVSPTATTTYTLTATNSAGSTVTATATVTVVSAPTITSFAASVTTITSGNTTKLTWIVNNASTVSIDNGVGTVTGSSVTVSPTATTTYTLTATNSAGGSKTATATVTVVAAPVISSFAPATSIVAYGGSTTLNWVVNSAATTLSISGIGTVTGTSYSVSPTSETSYTLTATNSAGASVTATATVDVLNITSFSSSTTSINAGGSGAILSWATTSNVSSLTLNTTITDANNTVTTSSADVTETSSLTINPTAAAYPATVKYVLVAADSNGDTVSSTQSITLTKTLGAIYSFLASPAASTSVGGTVALTAVLNSSDANSTTPTYTATITNDQGLAEITGLTTGTNTYTSPAMSKTTTYTLTVTDNAGGTQVQTLRVLVGTFDNYSGAVAQAITTTQCAAITYTVGSTASEYCAPMGMATDSSGNLYFADQPEGVIVKIDTSQVSSIVAGVKGSLSTYVNGSTSTATFFSGPRFIAVDSAGDIYELGAECGVRKISGGQVTTLAGLSITSVVGSNSTCSTAVDVDGSSSTASFPNSNNAGIVVDSAGDVIVAERYSIRAIDTNGNVLTIAGLCTTSANCTGSYADGSGSSARFKKILAVAIDANDVIYVMDDVRVRKITPTKCSGCTKASEWSWTVSTWINPNDNLGHADGPASAAEFYLPRTMTIDSDGTLYVVEAADSYDDGYIRRITQNGVVDTIAGDGNTTNYISTSSGGTIWTIPGPLPGELESGRGIAVDPTSKRLFFDDSVDSDEIFVMPR